MTAPFHLWQIRGGGRNRAGENCLSHHDRAQSLSNVISELERADLPSEAVIWSIVRDTFLPTFVLESRVTKDPSL